MKTKMDAQLYWTSMGVISILMLCGIVIGILIGIYFIIIGYKATKKPANTPVKNQ